MNYQEIEKCLQYNEKESKVFMPNEIFDDLQNNIKKTVHIPVAYSYYYLITWLYRYAKYGTINIDNKNIKQILGYNTDTQGIDYLMKKNGMLDVMGYTETVKDFPITWTFEDEYLDFEMLSEMDEDVQKAIKQNLSRKYTIKFPVKAFNRHIDDEEMKEEYAKGYEDGTFYELDNTHMIPFEVFMYCMNNDKIGCTGFYLYSYLKMKNQHFSDGYDCPMERLAKETGLPISTMRDSLDIIRKYKMVEGILNQEYFCIGLEDYKRKANTYITNNIELFTDEPIEYEKMKVLQVNEYYQMLNEQKEAEKEESFPLELLPF